jgi:hypothetical protein
MFAYLSSRYGKDTTSSIWMTFCLTWFINTRKRTLFMTCLIYSNLADYEIWILILERICRLVEPDDVFGILLPKRPKICGYF